MVGQNLSFAKCLPAVGRLDVELTYRLLVVVNFTDLLEVGLVLAASVQCDIQQQNYFV